MPVCARILSMRAATDSVQDAQTTVMHVQPVPAPVPAPVQSCEAHSPTARQGRASAAPCTSHQANERTKRGVWVWRRVRVRQANERSTCPRPRSRPCASARRAGCPILCMELEAAAAGGAASARRAGCPILCMELEAAAAGGAGRRLDLARRDYGVGFTVYFTTYHRSIQVHVSLSVAFIVFAARFLFTLVDEINIRQEGRVEPGGDGRRPGGRVIATGTDAPNE